MSKSSAFGTAIALGTLQVETAVVVGTITLGGNARVITTCTGMTGSPITTDFAVLLNDTADTVAEKMRVALRAVGNITALFTVGGSGPNVTLTKITAAANISDLNMAVSNQTCTGLTNDATSDDTTAGVAYTTVASVTNVGGPGLALDTADVTTHDDATAWEDVITTILRSGEVSMDIVYDPNAATHSTATNGLLDRYQDKTSTAVRITFPGSVLWYFSAYVTGFEPSAPFDGALTAAIKMKINGAPTLA